MRKILLTLSAATWLCVGVYLGCTAGSSSGDDDGGSTFTTGSGTGGNTTSTGTSGVDGGFDTDGGCANFTAEAEQVPAAMLIVLDATASMLTASKWQAAQLAVVAAVDKDVFDSMSLGLVTFPSGNVASPPCISQFVSTVTCGVSALPQVAMAPAGKEKSNAGSGVRSQIYNYLVNSGPVNAAEDGSPVYEAMLAGYNALKAYAGVDKRILVLISDGGFSCTSLSNPQRPAFTDLIGCLDWEHPDNINQLVTEHRTDPNTPVNTFIVGVPGSNTNGGKTGAFDNPPYQMLLALSTYAVSGSPETVPADCDSAAVFSQNGAPPAKPCHIDLSSGQFDANALGDAIAKIRGAALGCNYPLPDPPPGESIDLNQVNVNVTIDGNTFGIAKRSDPNDTCANDGCWDYNANNEVELLGKTCTEVSGSTTAKVDIIVGCKTVLK